MKAFLKKLLHFRYRNRSARFTLMGLRFVLITLAILIAAINTGNNLLYLILAMMLSFLILSGILSEETLRGLRVERVLPGHLFAGKAVPSYLRLKNSKHYFSSFSFLVQEMETTGSEAAPSYIFHLPARKSLLLNNHIYFRQRGRYRFKGIRFQTSYPFGFFQKTVNRIQEEQVVVFPELLRLPNDLTAVLGGLGDSISVNQKGGGEGIKNLREYIPGEDARAIHWKASARNRGLLLKEFEQENENRLALYLSNATSLSNLQQDHRKLECAISLTASLAYHWISLGHSLAVQTHSGGIAMGKGNPHLFRILDFLALLETVPHPSSFGRLGPMSRSDPTESLLILPCREPSWEGLWEGFSRIISVSDPILQACWEDHPMGIGS